MAVLTGLDGDDYLGLALAIMIQGLILVITHASAITIAADVPVVCRWVSIWNPVEMVKIVLPNTACECLAATSNH